MANNNQIYKMSNAGGFKSLTRYYDMLAGNTVWNPWEPQGAYDALATVTLTASTTSVTFAGIPTGYKHLQLRGMATGTTAYFRVRFNGDTGSNYAWHEVYGDGSSAVAGAGSSATFGVIEASSAGSSPLSGGLVTDILDYSSTNKNKTMRTLCGYDANGSGRIHLVSSLWMNSSTAINSIEIVISAGSIGQYSSFALYGVK